MEHALLRTEIAPAMTILEQGAMLDDAGQYGEAHHLYRQGLNMLLATYREDGHGETLWRAIMTFRFLAVTAFSTGRTPEGRLAVCTALMHVDVGLRHWPDAPPLLEEKAKLEVMAAKIGGVDTAYISDNLSWPFND